MKRKISFFSLLTAAFFGISLTTSAQDENVSPQENPFIEMGMPANVVALMEKSCFECHNTASEDEEARDDLNYDTFNEMSTFRKIHVYEEMIETVEEGEMPPEEYLEEHPDRALTEAEEELLLNWVHEEMQRLSAAE